MLNNLTRSTSTASSITRASVNDNKELSKDMDHQEMSGYSSDLFYSWNRVRKASVAVKDEEEPWRQTRARAHRTVYCLENVNVQCQ